VTARPPQLVIENKEKKPDRPSFARNPSGLRRRIRASCSRAHTIHDERAMTRCSSCGTVGPGADTIETTWARYGWRVSRRMSEGMVVVDFFCPACWKQRRPSPSHPPSA
jgi:hypothetical protein